MDEIDPVGWMNSLLQPKTALFVLLKPLIAWLFVLFGGFFGLALLLMLGWNLLTPLFTAPTMNYQEACGAAILVLLAFLAMLLLKEGKE